MKHYYCLVAQLPSFSDSAENALPISYKRFADVASRWLSESDNKILQSLSLEPPVDAPETGSRLVDAWNAQERDLRVALAQVRAGAMKKQFQSPAISILGTVAQLAKNASECENPLDAEKMLNASRLRFLDENAPLDAFCSDAIFAYGLRLLMAERIAKFNREAGSDSYHAIYNQILGDAK